MRAISISSFSVLTALILPLITLGQIPFIEHIIDDDVDRPWYIYAEDVDSDGDMDVLSAVYDDDEISWWENDGSQNFTKHVIGEGLEGPTSVHAADIDSDGDIDVIAAVYGDHSVIWWENDGNQNFIMHTLTVHFQNAFSVFIIDLDDDGDNDILCGADQDDMICWGENDGSQNFTAHIIAPFFDGARSVYAADLDNDGDEEVLGAAMDGDQIACWENDGNQNFTEHIIDNSFNGAYCVYAVDMDNDLDLDVIGAAMGGDEIAWWENRGDYVFIDHPIDINFNGAHSTYAADLDGDGDMDVLGAGCNADEIAWWKNDGAQHFTKYIIAENFEYATSVYAVDMDGDGDIDVLGAASDGYKISWFENISDPQVSITLTPYNYPIQIPSGGGNFQFDAVIVNMEEGFSVTLDAWLGAVLPDSTTVGPLAMRSDFVINPGDSVSCEGLTQYVPSNAPAGEYSYFGLAGNHPFIIWAQDSFTFEKLPGEGIPIHNFGWQVFGWEGGKAPFVEASEDFILFSAYPNPFNPQTHLTFSLQTAGYVSLTVYDIQGREVAKPVDEWRPVGVHQTTFDASGLSSGIYFARLMTGNILQTKKLLLIR